MSDNSICMLSHLICLIMMNSSVYSDYTPSCAARTIMYGVTILTDEQTNMSNSKSCQLGMWQKKKLTFMAHHEVHSNDKEWIEFKWYFFFSKNFSSNNNIHCQNFKALLKIFCSNPLKHLFFDQEHFK